MLDSNELKMLNLFFDAIALRPSLKGRAYFSYAFQICSQDIEILKAMTSKLYPEVAKRFGVNAKSVERDMRYSLETAWLEADLDILIRYFPDVDPEKGKPTNREFLLAVLKHLKNGDFNEL